MYVFCLCPKYKTNPVFNGVGLQLIVFLSLKKNNQASTFIENVGLRKCLEIRSNFLFFFIEN